MKKSLFVCAACLAIVSVTAQTPKSKTQSHALSTEIAPPPPPPPAPPAPPVEPIEPKDAIAPIPPVPPPPPVPPAPPEMPAPNDDTYVNPIVVNSIGYDISRHQIKGEDIVVIRRAALLQRIKLSTWSEDHKYYEKKYGQLPPAEV